MERQCASCTLRAHTDAMTTLKPGRGCPHLCPGSPPPRRQDARSEPAAPPALRGPGHLQAPPPAGQRAGVLDAWKSRQSAQSVRAARPSEDESAVRCCSQKHLGHPGLSWGTRGAGGTPAGASHLGAVAGRAPQGRRGPGAPFAPRGAPRPGPPPARTRGPGSGEAEAQRARGDAPRERGRGGLWAGAAAAGKASGRRSPRGRPRPGCAVQRHVLDVRPAAARRADVPARGAAGPPPAAPRGPAAPAARGLLSGPHGVDGVQVPLPAQGDLENTAVSARK